MRKSKTLNDIAGFAVSIEADGLTDVLLMGMGGSSLCPEVLALTFGADNFHILDSTVPAQIITVESKIELSKTLFIVASKSGSTLEPNCFKQYFFERLSKAVGQENAGKQFVTITDPGSKMEKVAQTDGFRDIFYGKPEIGGRFSALSAFGLTAGAAMGMDIRNCLQARATMARSCKATNPNENPGAILGTILGVCHSAGRDKLTIFTPPEAYDLGACARTTYRRIDRQKRRVDNSRRPRAAQIGRCLRRRPRVRKFHVQRLRDRRGDAADLQDIEDAGHPIDKYRT